MGHRTSCILKPPPAPCKCTGVTMLKDDGEATMKVVFDARGFVDRAKSDLDADGKPDKK